MLQQRSQRLWITGPLAAREFLLNVLELWTGAGWRGPRGRQQVYSLQG